MKTLKTCFVFLLTITFFLSCKKEYSYESGNKLTGGTWQFVNNATQYTGNIDSAFITDLIGTKVLTLMGTSLDGQENFTIRLNTTDNFTATAYLASAIQSSFDYVIPPVKNIFKGYAPAGEFIVNITSLANNHIIGTFSGIAEDSTGAQTQITLGLFSSAIDLSSNGNGNATSVGILGANPDTCTPVILSGNFITGIPLSASNTVQVEVNVTTPGTFSITTNSIKGIIFSKTGTFTATGVQNVILPGNGTPQAPGVEYFTVTYGTSHCTFKVTLLPGTGATGDYFPATIGSTWAYGLDGGTALDSMLTQVIPYAPSFGGNVFASFIREGIPASGNPDTTYYRKSVNDYIAFSDVSSYFGFDDPVYVEYTFLNDADAVGTVITSANFNGTVGGFPATGYIQTTISQKVDSININSMIYPDVIKVTYRYYYTTTPTIPEHTEIRWFARGVGLIYDNIDNFIIYDIGRHNVV